MPLSFLHSFLRYSARFSNILGVFPPQQWWPEQQRKTPQQRARSSNIYLRLFPGLHDMPRIHNPTTLRSRNRVTNKTRLKIHHGDIDFDPDDSPIPISNDTAGVDAEDANVSLPSFVFPWGLSSLSLSLLKFASWRLLIGCRRAKLNPWIAD